MPRRPLLCSFAVALTLAGAVPASALAQNPPASGAVERARESFRAGVAAYTQGEYRDALALFRQAYALAPRPQARLNIANCHLQLHQPVEAMENFEQYLAEVPEVPAAQRAEITAQMTQLRLQVGEIHVRVDGPTTGVRVTVDEREVRPGALVGLLPGLHVVRASGAAVVSASQSVQVAAGSQQDVMLHVEPVPPPAPAPVVIAPPPTPVVIAPPRPVAVVTPPPHAVPVAPVTVTPVPMPEAPVDDHKLGVGPFAVALTATGLALVGFGVCGGLALRANAAFQTDVANAQPGHDDIAGAQLQGARDHQAASSFALGSDVALGIAGIAAITTVVLVPFTRFGPRAVVSPIVARDTIGLSIGGSL